MALAAERERPQGPEQHNSEQDTSGRHGSRQFSSGHHSSLLDTRPGRPPRGGGACLPLAPSEREKESYAERNIALIIRASLASFGALLISQEKFVRTEPVLLAFAPLLVFTVAYYVISVVVNAGTRGFDLGAHRALVQRWRPRRYPSLDVFLPVCGEPLEVLNNTWSHVHELTREYPGETVVYVLDDGASDAVAAMAADYRFTYLVRPNRGWMKKAGNLRHGFARSAGEFILILDADFAPRPDLPLEMLPYLAADPTLGIVQSPQFFRVHRRQSWTERGAGAVQELFYRMVQVSRDHRDGAICVGSCAVYRREALATNGGTTLIGHSEDVHTGFDLRRAGWGLRYIPVPLATGLCPPDPDSFLIQQYRWCAGSMSLMGSAKFWTTRMPLRTRFCYLSGFCYYAHTAAFIFATPLIPIAMLTLLPGRVHLINYLFVLPSIIYNFVVFPAWHRCRYGPTALMAKLLYSWAHLFALIDVVRRRQLGWQPTGGGQRRAGTSRIWAGIWIWNGSTSAIWVLLALWRAAQYGVADFSVLLFGGVVTTVITTMALGARRNHLRTLVRAGGEDAARCA
ncbi:MAG TPA: cellulose synthase catalytic subunit [Trebonia sp.]|nr:cellulose synthase catalytic subunit [Trebonia sp.]